MRALGDAKENLTSNNLPWEHRLWESTWQPHQPIHFLYF